MYCDFHNSENHLNQTDLKHHDKGIYLGRLFKEYIVINCKFDFQ